MKFHVVDSWIHIHLLDFNSAVASPFPIDVSIFCISIWASQVIHGDANNWCINCM